MYATIGTPQPTSEYALNTSESKSIEAREPVLFSKLKGLDWVKLCCEKYPEILWLADQEVRKTEEGKGLAEGSFSQQLFGRKYDEFDRTITTLYCLRLILDGSNEAYETFTSAQPSIVKLSPESFKEMHLQGIKLLESHWEGLTREQMAEAMEAALVLGDMGKTAKAREIFALYGNQEPDQDDFYEKAMAILKQHPHLVPTYNKLSPYAQKLLQETAVTAHYGHITHLEGGPWMFDALVESGIAHKDPTALMFDLFIHFGGDVAGAGGHINCSSSLYYTAQVHQAAQAVSSSVCLLSDRTKNGWDAYNDCLSTRASWLGLNPHDRFERVLVRIGAMLRMFSLEEGEALKSAIAAIDPKTREQIIEQLDMQQHDLPRRTPTYMPALLLNLVNNTELGSSREERIKKGLSLGLPFIARVLAAHQKLLDKKERDSLIPLNFNKAAGVAKSKPSLLVGEFSIDLEGNVLLMQNN